MNKLKLKSSESEFERETPTQVALKLKEQKISISKSISKLTCLRGCIAATGSIESPMFAPRSVREGLKKAEKKRSG